MTFLPIVDRELRVAARRRGTYWSRAAVGFLAIAVGAFFYAVSWAVPARQVGQRMFESLTWIALFYCLFAGRRWTADCLSEEKREGTLGLLFLTDLRGYDVVLGKLAATSLNGFYGLLALVPILAIPLLLGGISNAQFWRVVLVLVNTFLFSLAIGIFVSAVSRDSRRALGANVGLLLLLIGVLPGCAAAIAAFVPRNHFYPALLFCCPFYSLYLCNDTIFGVPRWHLWASLGVTHAVTWLLLALASWVAPHSWQDRETVPRKGSWRERIQQWVYGRPDQRKTFRTRLLNVNAFYWLTSRARLKPLLVWVIVGALGLFWLWAWWKYGGIFDERFSPLNIGTAFVLNLTLKLWVAVEAGRQLADDRKSGSFELLLSSPLTVREILRGQWLALRRQLLWPLVAVILLEFLFMIGGARAPIRSYGTPAQDEPSVVLTWAAGITMLIADVLALGWVSLSASLTARSANHATISTVLRLLVLPWILYWALAAATEFSARTASAKLPSWDFYIGLWLAVGLAADLLFGLTAWIRLRSRFRLLAAERYAPAEAGCWGWYGRVKEGSRGGKRRGLKPRSET